MGLFTNNAVRSYAQQGQIHGDLLATLNQQLTLFADNKPDQPTTTFTVLDKSRKPVYEVSIDWTVQYMEGFEVVAVTSDGLLADLLSTLKWVCRLRPPIPKEAEGRHIVTFYYGLPPKK